MWKHGFIYNMMSRQKVDERRNSDYNLYESLL
jgi:hypothetical protein